jgi:hypothetical protein
MFVLCRFFVTRLVLFPLEIKMLEAAEAASGTGR